MEQWRLLGIREDNSAMQMAIDEAIAIACSEKKVSNTLRFYIWNPPTITVGYGQEIKNFNLDKIKEKGFGYVRRRTGGTAVLHKNDLTYSIILFQDEGMEDVVESYKNLSTGLVYGLRKLGLNAKHRIIDLTGNEKRTASCYSNKNEYDVVVNNKKISGSAQGRFNFVVLQHGTIIIEDNIEELIECLNIDENKKKPLVEKTKEKVTCIETELGKRILPHKLEEKLIQGFKQWGKENNISFVQGELTEYELNLAQGLYRAKYSTKEWNHKR